MLNVKIINLGKKYLPFSLRYSLRILKLYTLYIIQSKKAPASKKVKCPILEEEFKTFVKKNGNLYTWKNEAKARHRMIWLYIKNKTDLLTGKKRLLHVAPEHCLLMKFAEYKNLDYYPADKLEPGYDYGSKINYIDLLNAEIESESFDAIMCNHVLEHIADDKTAMSEMYRLLKNNGIAIITVPLDETLAATYEDFTITEPRERIKHFGQWDHVRWYATDIKERLNAVGFTTELVKYYKEFSPEDFNYYGLEESLIIVAKKIQ